MENLKIGDRISHPQLGPVLVVEYDSTEIGITVRRACPIDDTDGGLREVSNPTGLYFVEQ